VCALLELLCKSIFTHSNCLAQFSYLPVVRSLFKLKSSSECQEDINSNFLQNLHELACSHSVHVHLFLYYVVETTERDGRHCHCQKTCLFLQFQLLILLYRMWPSSSVMKKASSFCWEWRMALVPTGSRSAGCSSSFTMFYK